MKTSNYIVFILLAVLAAACSKDDRIPEPPGPDPDGLVEMSFTATAPEAILTRTSLGEGSGDLYPVLWSGGDEIAVIPRMSEKKRYREEDIAKMKFAASIEGGTAATATFTGRTEESDNGYFAFYPHCNLYQYINATYNAMTFTLPTEQQAMAGNFEPNLCPAYATTDKEGGDLTFTPMCGLVKFSLSGDAVADLASVRFEAAGQVLSGTLNYSIY